MSESENTAKDVTKARGKAAPKLSKAWLATVRANLSALPPPEPDGYTRQEAIIELAPLIRGMQDKKYRLEDILSVVNYEDAGFTLGSLKTYLARAPKVVEPVPETPKATGSEKKVRVKKDAQSTPAASGKSSEVAPTAPAGGQQEGSYIRAPQQEDSV